MKKCNFNSKNFITITITLLSSIVTLCVICVALGQKKFEFIASSLFPLIGTWMGAIIAYYFAKENFDAAANQYNKVIDKLTPEQQLSSISVASVMKLIKNTQTLQFEQFKSTPIIDILQNPNFTNYNRFLFLDNSKCKYIIHRSTFDRVISNAIINKSDPNSIKLEDFVKSEDESIKGYIEKGIEFISINRNLLDAKNLIISNKFCLDVIVTANGDKNDDVMGWITDIIISEKVKN